MSPILYKGEAAAFSPLTSNEGKELTNFAYLGFSQSPHHAGVMSPAAPGYSPSSLNIYSPTSPYIPQSLFAGATLPFSTSPDITSPFYDHGHVPTSPTYSPTSPALNLSSAGYLLTSPWYSPTSPSFLPTSPRYSPQLPSLVPHLCDTPPQALHSAQLPVSLPSLRIFSQLTISLHSLQSIACGLTGHGYDYGVWQATKWSPCRNGSALTSPRTMPHPLCGPRNRNQMQYQQWDGTTNAWAK